MKIDGGRDCTKTQCRGIKSVVVSTVRCQLFKQKLDLFVDPFRAYSHSNL
jgi:hypothetical protein